MYKHLMSYPRTLSQLVRFLRIMHNLLPVSTYIVSNLTDLWFIDRLNFNHISMTEII